MLTVGGLIGIVGAALILHVVGVFGCRIYNEMNPEQVIPFYHCKATSKIRMLRWLLLGLALLSLAISIIATTNCEYLTSYPSWYWEHHYGYGNKETYFGLSSMGDADSKCERYSDLSLDSQLEVAFVFGVLNCVLTGMGSLLLVLVMLYTNGFRKRTHVQDSIWNALQWILYISLWCCGLTFYALESLNCGSDCRLGNAGIAQVVNAVLLVIISVLSVVAVPPANDNDPFNHPGRVTPINTAPQAKDMDMEAIQE